MKQAAAEVGISRRTLTTVIGNRLDCCFWGGRKKQFDESHIELLKQLIEERTKCRLSRTAGQAQQTGGSTSKSKTVSGFEEVLEHLTSKRRKPSVPKSKRRNGKDKSMVIAFPSHSPRP
jgi:transposase